jgi:CHAT domain/WD domain, G-beta repeat
LSQDRDFVIELDGRPGSYRLHVASPAGDGSLDIGFDPKCLAVGLDMVQAQILASATRSRSAMTQLEQPLRRVGEALFETVFQAPIRALFLSSRNEVEGAGGRLRIALRLHPPELARLPWELMFSDRNGGYLSWHNPMVRYAGVAEPVRPLPVTQPLRVLGMTALPGDGDLPAFGAGAGKRLLQQSLAPLRERGLVTVDWVPGQSWEAAQEALHAGCQVFHLIGHGGFDPGRREVLIAFADERGRRQLMTASALADQLSRADPAPRLVAFYCCQTRAGADVLSSTAATLLRTVPAVVAMQFAVTDDAAAVFSRAFYKALACGRGVDEAVRAGRVALTGWNAGTLEWVTPVLYVRPGNTRLFDLIRYDVTAGRLREPMPSRKAVLARYRATRSMDDWDPVIAQLWALRRRLPGDREVEKAYQDALLAARYAQGRLAEGARSRHIAALQEQLRKMFTAGEFRAVAGIADRLTELDPAAADPDGLTTRALRHAKQNAAHPASTGHGQAAIRVPGAGPGQRSRPSPDTGATHIPAARADRRPAHPLAGPTWLNPFVSGVTFSPDGRLLASCDDETVRLWDPATGAQQCVLNGHTGRVNGVAFSPDGRLLASCDDETVRLWDPATGAHQRTLKRQRLGHGCAVRS